MGKIRDLFNNIGYIKGTFYARMGMVKDRNGKDITETEEIKTELARIHKRTIIRKVLMIWITMMMWSLTWSWTFLHGKSYGLRKHCYNQS